MTLVTSRCFRRVLLVAALLAAPRAHAEPVTHQFTGQVTAITNGVNGSLDLTGVFSLGQAVTLAYTIERDTPPVQQDAYVAAYTGAITDVAFSVDTWSGSGTPGFSQTVVSNDLPAVAVTYDQFSSQVQGGIVAPDIGGSTLLSLTWTLDDVEGAVFGTTAIPRVFPDLGGFEGKTLTILLFDIGQLRTGYVMATFGGVTTPAQASTWGGVKALYR